MRTRPGCASILGIVCWICSICFVYRFATDWNGQDNVKNSVIEEREEMSDEAISSNSPERTNRHKTFKYDTDMPLIFIGGMPRSGTTLMRAMLDAHPDVRCGQETRIIPSILEWKDPWVKSPEKDRLEKAGISQQVINEAIAQFILEIIVEHGKFAERLCNKDPFTMKSIKYLKEIFPNSKFLLMIRDGRATAHSIISRKITISEFNLKSYRDVLRRWNGFVETMCNQCWEVGPETCLMVRYEQLVLQPIEQSKIILNFLDIPWSDAVLNHEKYISNISLSNAERSTDQVQRPLYLDALTSWFGHIPADVARDLPRIAPMLVRLGYDPTNPKPKYGEPDNWVLDKVRQAVKKM